MDQECVESSMRVILFSMEISSSSSSSFPFGGSQCLSNYLLFFAFLHGSRFDGLTLLRVLVPASCLYLSVCVCAWMDGGGGLQSARSGAEGQEGRGKRKREEF